LYLCVASENNDNFKKILGGVIMKSVSLRDYGSLAREAFVTLMLSVLLLVTGCSSNDYTPRAALAPPPPFMASVQSFGPPVPAEIAMVKMMDNIMPAAGTDFFVADTTSAFTDNKKCLVGSSFTQNSGRFELGTNIANLYSSEHRFSSLHEGGSMTLRMTFALPSPVKKTVSCR
jgi:hypothetical protein